MADGGECDVARGRVLAEVQPGARVQVVGADGELRDAEVGEHVSVSCSACNGTGHNLCGFLPPLPEETLSRLTPSFRAAVHRAVIARGPGM